MVGLGKMRGIGCLLAVMLMGLYGIAGELPGVWKTYTSKKEVRDVALRDGVAWAATSGGLFSVRLNDERIQAFTTADGLRTNDLTAVTVDASGNVWLGAANGLVITYNPSSSQWKYIGDILRDEAPQKRINQLAVRGDTVYIASDIGISQYIAGRDEFRFTARMFGANLAISGFATCVMVRGDSIWAGTQTGIVVASLSHPNLSTPSAWDVRLQVSSLNSVLALATFRDTVYAGTTLQGMLRFASGSWTVVPGTTGKKVARIVSHNDILRFVTSKGLETMDSSGMIAVDSSFAPLTSLAAGEGFYVLGSERNGVYMESNGIWQTVVPDGPPTNRIVGIAIDETGTLWAGTGSGFGEGFMSFDGTTWKSYRKQDHPLMEIDEYYKVNIGRGNTKWVSSFGRGVALVDAAGNIQSVFNARNGLQRSGFGCNSSDDIFVVVASVVTSRDGRAFIVTRPEILDTTIAVLQEDSTFSYVQRPSSAPSCFVITDAVIDPFGTIWFTNSKEGNDQALFFYNERGFPGNTTQTWGKLTVDNGLAANSIYSLAIDNTDQLWVGTGSGINIFPSPYSAQPRPTSYTALLQQKINYIAVDPVNNKWVATPQGVFVLSSDGTQIREYYTVVNTNGRLVDDNIQSIAIDAKTGTVYFGSDRGLSALTTAAAAPQKSFKDLEINPNPFYIPSSTPITVDGLVQNSLLKVLSIDGRVVRDIKTPGGRLGYWDGKDMTGNYVSSGVYVVVAFSENGSEVATGKVAVLKR
jgi:ligand-binding sensor domain-containing protein